MFKVGDKLKVKESMWTEVSYSSYGFNKDTYHIVSTVYDGLYPSISFVGSGYRYDAAYFELAEGEKVKNKFAVGDKVISIKNTPEVPEGFIGHIASTAGSMCPYTVDDEKGEFKCFNEDELELLSVGKKETKFNPTLSEIENYNFPDTITPQDIAGVSKSALDKQIGGGHYKEKGIQPIEYIFANNLGFCEANIVKYATRWKDKNGIQDLEKIIHYTELLIELTKKEESKDKEGK